MPEGGVIGRHTLTASALVALALVLLQFSVIRFSPWELPVRIIVPATIAAIPLALWSQRRHAGVWVIFVGMAANLAVVGANGGLMPIEPDSVAAAIGVERADSYTLGAWIHGSKDVLVTHDGGRAVALGDSIVVRTGTRGVVASPGDVVILAGLLMLAGESSLAWQRGQRARHRLEQNAPPRGARGGATTPQ